MIISKSAMRSRFIAIICDPRPVQLPSSPPRELTPPTENLGTHDANYLESLFRILLFPWRAVFQLSFGGRLPISIVAIKALYSSDNIQKLLGE